MTQSEAETLNRLFENGYLIQYVDGPYVNGNINNIQQIEDKSEANELENYADDNIKMGDYVFSDDVYEDAPLSKVEISKVKVYARVDWLYKIPENERLVATVGLGVHKNLASLQDWNEHLDKAYDI